jgi:MscS family membrane protein
MIRRWRPLLAAALAGAALFAPAPARAQIPGIAASPSPEAEAEGDPYKRETPYSSFMGFMRAASRENWTTAGEYLQWPKGSRTPREEMAKKFKAVVDERFMGNLEKLSRSPLSNVDDGLGPGYERAGILLGPGEEAFDVLLVRTQPPEGPPVWLVSSQTLREIPAAFSDLSVPELDQVMPQPLRREIGRSYRVWQILALLLIFPASWFLARVLVTGAARLAGRAARQRKDFAAFRHAVEPFRTPLVLLLTIPITALLIGRLGLPLLGRFAFGRMARVAFVLAIAWLVIRLIDFLTMRAARRLVASGQATASSLTIGRTVLQGSVVAAAVLAVLSVLGVNLTATLAGLGIGGLVLAFAAQKSLENIFGGVVVLSDRIVRVGDLVKVGTVEGAVEDVTLYATRIRTVERALVSIPNGMMMASQIVNLSRRDKFLFRHTLGLTFETTSAQIQAVLHGCRAELDRDSRVESSTSRVRLLKLNAYSLDVEVFAYLVVPDWLGFLAAQEEILLALMGVVERAGSGFAFPTQTTYLASDIAALGRGATAPPEPPKD